jgi:hypothetical protein
METLVRLLHDCDKYLESQRALLSRASSLGHEVTAMNASLDQFDKAVRIAWLETLTEMIEKTGCDLQNSGGRPADRAEPATADPDHLADPGE